MNRSLKLVTVLSTLACGSAWADIVPVVNPNFSSPAVTCATYAYDSTTPCGSATYLGTHYPTQDLNGYGWTYLNDGGNGLTLAGSDFNPPPFVAVPFTQVAFLQGNVNSVSQTLTGTAGTWTVSFYLGSRYGGGGYDGAQTVVVKLGGLAVGTYNLSNSTPFTLVTTAPQFGGTTRDLEFLGTASGDHTAFISGVSVVSPEPSAFGLLSADLGGLGVLLGLGSLSRRFLRRS